jgi:peroxiredoxin
MLKKITTAGSGLLFCATALFAQGKTYTIQGNIKGLQTGYAMLGHMNGDKRVMDSVKIVNGNFVLNGNTLPYSDFYFFSVKGTKIYQLTFMNGGTLKLSGDKDDSKAQITGTPLADEYNQYENSMKEVMALMGENARKGYAWTDNGKKKRTPEQDSILSAEYRYAEAKGKVIIEDFITKHPNSDLSAYLISNFYSQPQQAADQTRLFALLSPKAQQSHYGKGVQAAVAGAAKTAIGIDAPVFVQQDTLGHDVNLASFKGKYVLVDFWASWCGPCRKENPNVVKAFNKYKNKNFTIIGVSLDSDKSKWEKAIAQDGLAWTHVSDLKGWNNAAALDYYVKSVPANFLIDPNGKIIAKNLRGEDLEKMLEEKLSN